MKLSCMIDIDRNFSFGAFCAHSAILPSCNLLHIYRKDITSISERVTSLSVADSDVPSKFDMDKSICSGAAVALRFAEASFKAPTFSFYTYNKYGFSGSQFA
ncbi:hypothetical protein Plhal304r1_c097g0174031 [Plasmopara halstedii]